MGKTTGFMDYTRKTSSGCSAAGAHRKLQRISHLALPRGAADAGGPLHGLRRSLLSGGHDDRRHGLRLPAEQPDPGVERPDLSGQMGAGAPPAACHQPLSGVHEPGLPRPVRGGLHLRRRDRQQRHRPRERTRHRGDGLRKGLAPRRPAPRPHRQERGRHRQRPGRPFRGRVPQHPGPRRHRFRAGRPGGRPADVRHPQHEAGQIRHRAPHQDHAGRRRGVPHQHGHRRGRGRRGHPEQLRCRGALLRREKGPRPECSRPGRQGRPLRRGLPDQRDQEPAGQPVRRRQGI